MALAVAALAILQPAEAGYGCWTGRNAKFHRDCEIAATSMIHFMTSGNSVKVPSYILTSAWGNCMVETKADKAASVSLKSVMLHTANLVSRCQRGYFTINLPNGNIMSFNVLGASRWGKRDVTLDTDVRGEIDGGLLQSKAPEPLTPLRLESEESAPDSASDAVPELNERQHARDIIERADNRPIYTVRAATGSAYALFRNTQSRFGTLAPSRAMLNRDFPAVIRDMIRRGLGDRSQRTLECGIEILENNRINAAALTVRLEVNQGRVWQDVFAAMGDQGNAIALLADAVVRNYADGGWTYAFYHVADQHGATVLSFIINGVLGQDDDFPDN